jgi:lipopolysaccharide/colanic/teichoic acid biosynthesis glycosyltransferase
MPGRAGSAPTNDPSSPVDRAVRANGVPGPALAGMLPEDARAVPRGRGYSVTKRITDLTVSGVALIVLAPLLLAVTAAIWATSGRPVFFRQHRIGAGLEPFSMWKFRTMHNDTDDSVHRAYISAMLASPNATPSSAGLYKLEDDRITAIGRVLRRTSIDELPQLINVMLGHMSLVGPRPALPYELELFERRMLVRFTVKPGITGLWQVSGRSRLPMNRALELDREYVERRSFALDAKILLKTVPIVILARDAG